ncbi:MAG: gamma-glutamyl-gamma-aminobutyrate hydrolase family protein [Deltaproteobacteria bacterium]|nr:gamma-glutamyl-gamma-aminobutyrate hydrolase family protein [Deltaproteobacteria bacterium]
MKILMIDNNIDQPWGLCADFRRYLEGQVVVRRAPQSDLPKDLSRFTHVVLSGSRTCILDSDPWVKDLMAFVRRVVDGGTPMLGICYGHQIIARAHGGDGTVRISPTPEIGWVEIRQTAPNPVLEGLPKKFHTFQSHFEEVCKAPAGFVPTATTERCAIQAYYVEGKPVFGVQFHPERDAQEGEESIKKRRSATPPVPNDCIFNEGKAKSVYSENVARTIFNNFLRQRGSSQ